MSPGTLQIGGITLKNRLALAPMAGVTNLPFRLMAKEQGVGLVCTETLSARAIVHGSEKTYKMFTGSQEERPLAAQIFGSDPDILAEAAARLEASGVDILDINFGCPVTKFVRSFAGSVLMREPDKVRRILVAVRKRIRFPLTPHDNPSQAIPTIRGSSDTRMAAPDMRITAYPVDSEPYNRW